MLLRALVAILLATAALLTFAACGGSSDVTVIVSDAAEVDPKPTPTQTPGASNVAQQYNAPPPLTIDPDKSYTATMKTDKGDIVIELFANKVPNTVNNFVFLAREGFYNGTTFHRVLTGFMAQGGDPTGTGSGGPGYRFADEFDPTLRHDKPGMMSMANAGPNTNGSQFFLTHVPTPHLDGRHAVFGQVTGGLDVLLSLTVRDPNQNPSDEGDKLIEVVITEE